MSNIYHLDVKGMRKALIDFHKTLYGRTAFFLAYFIPALAFLSTIGFTIVLFIEPETTTFIAFYSSLGVFVVSFIIGNAYYYRELKDFLRNK